MMNVSLVFPYVNSNDKQWQKEYKKFYPFNHINTERFRDSGLLKYIFRGIAECMPWLHDVTMLVSSESQVPDWLTNVNIVTHKQFIPKEYLPVFNSNAIEMFLANIPNLSEGIIYSNDDCYPISYMPYSSYFNAEDQPRITYSLMENPTELYAKQCYKDWKTVANLCNYIGLDENEYYNQYHEPQCTTLKYLKEASNLLKSEREASITRIRDLNVNLSQHIYFNYLIANNLCVKCRHRHIYSEITLSNMSKIRKTIQEQKAGWIILNDTEKLQFHVLKRINKLFETRFPEKCKYEK